MKNAFLFRACRIARPWIGLAGAGLFAAWGLPTASAQAISFRERFGSVKQWRLTYQFSCDSPYAWNDGPISRNRTRWTAHESGSVVITMSLNGGDRIHGEGFGPASAEIDRFFVEQTQFYSDSRYDRGGGSTTARARLWLDLNAGTYEMEIRSEDIPECYGGRRTQVGHEARNWGPTEGTTHTPMPAPLAPHGIHHLPASGVAIDGNWSWERQIAGMATTSPDFDRHEWSKRDPTNGTLRWTLEPDDPLDDELIVEVVDYDNWLPKGGRDESTTGNTVSVKATLRAKSGGEPTRRPVRFDFKLAEVSREPGVALNFPLADAKRDPDLIFEATRNPRAVVQEEGLALMVPGSGQPTAAAEVSSRDWGAYGTVTVTATLDNGRVVHGKLAGASDSNVRLPKRPALSRIGDAWKRAVDFSGADADDLDEQQGNNHDGDGLTAYEEYRGLIMGDHHSRDSGDLLPRRKELIVANELGAIGKSGLALFEQASGIHVIELAPDALPPSRIVNLNRGSVSPGEQYGLVLRKGALADTAGENRPAAVLDKTPKKSVEVVIDTDNAPEFYAGQAAAARAVGDPMPFTLAEYLDNTIAHEVAHGVGAPHHGKDREYFGPRTYTVTMRDWRAFGADGVALVPTADHPIEIKGRIGRPGNEASGDTSCIMTYTNYYTWVATGPSGGPYRFYALPLQPVGKRFCTSATATGINRQHTVGRISLPGFFGNAEGQGGTAPVGNCLGAMKVRDW